VRCGSDVICAFTYYAHREKMRLVGREHQLEDLNRQAIRIAKAVAQQGNCLVAGDISNSTIWDEKSPELQEEVSKMFREQCQWAKEEGVDFIIAETISTFGEATVALEEILRVGLPAVITVRPFKGGIMQDKISVVDCLVGLAKAGATVVGLNCGFGPATMYEMLKDVKQHIPPGVGLAALPVPYRTTKEHPTMQSLCTHDAMYLELEPHTHTRAEIAVWAKKFHEIGVNYIGVCCGGEPYMLRSMAEILGRKPPASENSPDLTKHFVYGKIESIKKAVDENTKNEL